MDLELLPGVGHPGGLRVIRPWILATLALFTSSRGAKPPGALMQLRAFEIRNIDPPTSDNSSHHIGPGVSKPLERWIRPNRHQFLILFNPMLISGNTFLGDGKRRREAIREDGKGQNGTIVQER